MKTLLEKTRALNKLLQKNAGNPVYFNEITRVLSNMIECNVFIVGRRGKVLGYSLIEDFQCEIIEDIITENERFPEEYNENLLRTTQTQANIRSDENNCVFEGPVSCPFGGKISTIVPIMGGGERQGTLLLAIFNTEFDESDLILAEYGATVVGMEILSAKLKNRRRARKSGKIVIGTLSYSELEAIEHIFAELDGSEVLAARK